MGLEEVQTPGLRTVVPRPRFAVIVYVRARDTGEQKFLIRTGVCGSETSYFRQHVTEHVKV